MTASRRSRANAAWRSLDPPGEETVSLRTRGDGWLFTGRIQRQAPEGLAQVRYEIDADQSWRTMTARVRMIMAESVRRVLLASDGEGRWTCGAEDRPDLRGCVDLDFSATPATNTLPIRRLGLLVGGSAEIRVAWLRFPDLIAVPASQRYTRLSPARYRYESLEGQGPSARVRFAAEFDVDERGFVLDYPGFWERRSAGRKGRGGVNP